MRGRPPVWVYLLLINSLPKLKHTLSSLPYFKKAHGHIPFTGRCDIYEKKKWEQKRVEQIHS